MFCVGPLCGPPLRWWVLCGVLPSVWVPCWWGPPLSFSRFPWHLCLVSPRARARALALVCIVQLFDVLGAHGGVVGRDMRDEVRAVCVYMYMYIYIYICIYIYIYIYIYMCVCVCVCV